ncbi:MAG: DNA mismatch repair endonuclease MutL, partial [Clostridia bacterium]|nr:DNA mismatch repair endonuclease MutL [Clostridia bacterium]
MGIINVLDIQVANLIAAGEVVERPASVVKELLENSIDAGADRISVDIKHGGVSYIRVSDNGIGMSRDDLPISIKRHATSKIRDQRDLDGIMTLGFRGEALAAISSVSKVTITTRRKEDAVGSKMTAEPGEDIILEECGCPAGTTVVVEELFRNVPARRKFLKRDATESMAVTAVVEKTALSNPSVSIKYSVDGALRFNTTGDGKLGNAIYSVLGREFASGLIPVRGMTEGIEINGYTGRPDAARSNRNFENFFLNGRYIKSRTISAA